MAHIIAGRFQEQEQVTQVIDAMLDAGVAQDRICSFYLNPPGQHNLYPIGGDREDSPGAHETAAGVATGATTGGVVGAAVGLTGAPFFGPVGPAVGALVGAHVGGLIGSLTQMKEKGEGEAATEEDDGDANATRQRKSGMLVAVSLDGTQGLDALGAADNRQQEIVRVLHLFGADDIEEADGVIIDGDWQDFDPLQAPKLIGTHASHGVHGAQSVRGSQAS